MSTDAVFLGSFNPWHNGHAAVVSSVLCSRLSLLLGLRNIYVIPAYQNPFKKNAVGYEHRVRTAQEGIKVLNSRLAYTHKPGTTDVLVNEIEGIIHPDSTYELFQFIKSGYCKEDKFKISEDFWWIVTDETYRSIINWKNGQELLDSNKFIVVSENPELSQADKLYVKMHKTIDKHSTDIRNMMAEFHKLHNPTKSTDAALDVLHALQELSPQTVVDYCLHNKLYRSDESTDSSKQD